MNGFQLQHLEKGKGTFKVMPKGHLIFSLRRKWYRNRSNENIQFLFLTIFTSCPNAIAILEGFFPKKVFIFFLGSSFSYVFYKLEWQRQESVRGAESLPRCCNKQHRRVWPMCVKMSACEVVGRSHCGLGLGKGCISSQLSGNVPCYKGWAVEGINTITNTSGT